MKSAGKERISSRKDREKCVWSDKKRQNKRREGKVSREKAEKRSENPSLSLSPRVSH